MTTNRRESARRLRNEAGALICSCGCGRMPEPPRRTWFSKACVDEWRIKNDPAYVRSLVKRRDRGICALCNTDTLSFKAQMQSRLHDPLRHWEWWVKKRAEELVSLHATWSHAWHAARLEFDDWKEEIKTKWAAHSAWQADHIVPVCEGGGQCGLENYRTLCTACHQRVTAALAQRRAAKALSQRRASWDAATFQLTA